MQANWFKLRKILFRHFLRRSNGFLSCFVLFNSFFNGGDQITPNFIETLMFACFRVVIKMRRHGIQRIKRHIFMTK